MRFFLPFFIFVTTLTASFEKNINLDILKKSRFILDASSKKNEKTKRFRTPSESLKQSESLNLNGYKDLKISGSAQFSADQWISIKDHLLKHFALKPEDIYVIDLREEPHFFVNGDSISLAVDDLKKDDILKFEAFIGVDKDNMQLFEQDLILELNPKKTLNVVEVLSKKKKIFGQKYKKKTLNLDTIETERELVQKIGAHYIRFSVTDHKRPTDKLIDGFLDFLNHLPENAWLHFHCRGGVGRTSSFMLMMDIIKNAKNLSLETLIARNVEDGGSKKLFDLKSLGISKFKDGLVRRDFLISFYNYVKDPKGYKTTPWSTWIKNNKK